jgi:D-3-phosphoglycerate dehydrogenase
MIPNQCSVQKIIKMVNILIAEPTHSILQEKLEESGFRCVYLPQISFEKLKEIIADYEGLVIRSKFNINREFIDSASRMKFIARAGSGMENMDVEYARSKLIECINSPEGNRDSLGEHTIGMLLGVLHKINLANAEVKSGIWNRKTNIGIELQGKTVGILGYGNMGSAFAQRLSGFSTNVIAYDIYKNAYSDQYVKEVDMETFFNLTDILSIHVPLTEETLFMINDSYINSFRKDIFLINTARGKIVKTDDLVKNLDSGKVKGACLDVLEYESHSFETGFNEKNPALSFLFNAKNVILTPHVAGSSDASYKKIAEVLADKIVSLFQYKQ